MLPNSLMDGPKKSLRLTPCEESYLSDSREARAQARLRIERLRQQKNRQKELETKVTAATSDPYLWLTEHTKTFNEHWQEEQRPNPYEPFPRLPYFKPLLDIFQNERIILIEKSRDMMISWACVGYLLWEAMRVPERGIVLQTLKEDKVEQLVDYAKCLYRWQPDWLKEYYPLAKPLERQGALELQFKNGAYVIGLPGGADQVRSYHPWGYMNDESSFQPEAGECYNEALAAVKGKLIFNSSAGPGWFADFRRDVVRNEED
jgi:hypothetical protein